MSCNVPLTIAATQTIPKLSGVRIATTLWCSPILWVRDSGRTQKDSVSLLPDVEKCKNLASMILPKPLH